MSLFSMKIQVDLLNVVERVTGVPAVLMADDASGALRLVAAGSHATRSKN
jgi:hypothetical protein